MTVMIMTVPDGVTPGDSFCVDAAGQEFVVCCPDGVQRPRVVAIVFVRSCSAPLRLKHHDAACLRSIEIDLPIEDPTLI